MFPKTPKFLKSEHYSIENKIRTFFLKSVIFFIFQIFHFFTTCWCEILFYFCDLSQSCSENKILHKIDFDSEVVTSKECVMAFKNLKELPESELYSIFKSPPQKLSYFFVFYFYVGTIFCAPYYKRFFFTYDIF